MTNRRFISSIVATAQTTSVQMPWHRELRAAKVAAKRADKIVNLADLRRALKEAA